MVITAADRAAFFRENPNKRAASPGEIQQWVNARIAVATAVANNNQSAVRGKVPDWFNQLDAQNSSMTPQARGVLIRALQDIEPKVLHLRKVVFKLILALFKVGRLLPAPLLSTLTYEGIKRPSKEPSQNTAKESKIIFPNVEA